MTQTISSGPADVPTRHTLRNKQGMEVTLSDRGATLISWLAPDRYGNMADVLLGYPDDAGYRQNPAYFGALVGRWANRIAGGRFTLDGVDYELDKNNGNNQLHGGAAGFHLAQWRGEATAQELQLTYASVAGEGGFPGNLQVRVCYRLEDDGSLCIEYEATTDAATPINLTSHPYFNLNGGRSGIDDHMLSIDAEHYLSVDDNLIPQAVTPVSGTAFDFRLPASIGARLTWPDAQLAVARGFDHCYCLQPQSSADSPELRDVATVYDPGSGRVLTVATTEIGLQFYSGNWLGGVQGRGRPGSDQTAYTAHAGFCLEAQSWPNQINAVDGSAEAVVLRPGSVYRQTTVYRITVRE